MKRILVGIPILIVALTISGCASPLSHARWTASVWTQRGSGDGGGIDPVTQAGIDQTAAQTQEDAMRMSQWVTDQNNLNMMNQEKSARDH